MLIKECKLTYCCLYQKLVYEKIPAELKSVLRHSLSQPPCLITDQQQILYGLVFGVAPN